jgi:hypothetical protein
MSKTPILAFLLTALLITHATANDPPERFLFYLHGQIVEGSDGRPEHPNFGIYDYPAIIKALETEGFTVISEIRESSTDGRKYAETLAAEVQALLDDGTPAQNISIVGASKGGGIAVAASSILENEGLNFVFMGTCVNWIQNWPELELRGRILSITEKTDTVAGSCAEPFSNSDLQPEFREILINTDRNHGAFYEPVPEWLNPVVIWCRGEDP